MTPVTLPPKLRAAIYVVYVLATAVIVPLGNAHIFSDLFMSVWASVSAAVVALAALNVKGSQ